MGFYDGMCIMDCYHGLLLWIVIMDFYYGFLSRLFIAASCRGIPCHGLFSFMNDFHIGEKRLTYDEP